MGDSVARALKLLTSVAVAVGIVAAPVVIATTPALAADTISVSASYQLNTSEGYTQKALDPNTQTDVTAGNILVSLTITNSGAEPYTLASVTPTTPSSECAGTIAPGASLDCYVSPTVDVGKGVLDLTLTGSYPTSGADTTVVSYPYFGIQYTFHADDFAVQAPPPATGWITTIPDPQLLIYPGLFRPIIRLALSWGGNAPITINQATRALAPVSTQCFGALPKVVQPGDPIMSCDFSIMPTLSSWGFTYTGAMNEPQAYTGFLSYTAGGSCKPNQQSYAGGETIVVDCENFAPGVSAQARIWDVGVTAPQTVSADGTVSFSYALPTITTGFASGSLIFREGGDPAVESAGPVTFTINPGTASTSTGSGSGSGSGGGDSASSTDTAPSDTPELADSGTDLSGPLALATVLLASGIVVAGRRRKVS